MQLINFLKFFIKNTRLNQPLGSFWTTMIKLEPRNVSNIYVGNIQKALEISVLFPLVITVEPMLDL